MKQHIFSQTGRLLILFSMFLTFFACQQDLQVAPKEIVKPSYASIQSAKVWFEQNENTILTGKNEGFKDMKPLWEEAIAYDEIVEVPYTVNERMAFPRITGTFKQLGKQNLILQKNGNAFDASIISYVPSDNFNGVMKSVNVRNLESKKFDGTISSQNWDVEQFDRWHYEDGRVIQKTKGKIIPQDEPLKEDLSCKVAYDYVDLYQTIAMGPYWDIKYVETIKIPIIVCVEVGTPSDGCRIPYCGNNPVNTGSGNNGLPTIPTGNGLVPIRKMCVESVRNALDVNAKPLGEWTETTTNHIFNGSICHGITLNCKNLQTTGRSRQDILIFQIDIYCPKSRPLDYIAISSRIAKAYNNANENSTATNSDDFMNDWAKEFNRNMSTSSSNNLYFMTATSIGQVTTPIGQYTGSTLQNESSSCR